MKAVINPKASEIFKSANAIYLFDKFKSEYGVYESGIDTNGKIYFAKSNGNIERYTRKKFLKIANGHIETDFDF